MKHLLVSSCVLSLLSSSALVFADEQSAGSLDDSHTNTIITSANDINQALLVDIGWDSKYISEGRNNLDNSGIYWATAAYQIDDLTVYAISGRADNEHYIEWNLGLEYGISLGEHLAAAVGYQRIEAYGDERCSDNELFASLEYSALEWLTPSLTYTFSTEAGGYFVEASLHSSWPLSDNFTLTPYATQAFDFQYATEAHNGANHFQFGLEAEYYLSNQWVLSGHISHIIAQQDIKQDNASINSSLDQTYAGLHMTWIF